jgi:hypothetical protein
MSINIVVSLMLNDPLKTIHPIEEDILDVDESQVFQNICHGSENFFNSLQLTVFHFLLHHFEEPKVAWNQI